MSDHLGVRPGFDRGQTRVKPGSDPVDRAAIGWLETLVTTNPS